MNYRNIPLNGLKTFECFARHLHMEKAAQELGVTHSAVSHQIKRLENHFGIALIFKEGKKSKLTARGVALHEEIQLGFSLLHQATLNLDPDLSSGKIRLACTSALCRNWLISLLAKFFTLHPSINFELINIDINTKLISDDIDLAICYGLPNTDRLVRKLLDIHLCPIASKSLFKGKNVPASVLELLSFPILLDNEQNWEHLISASKVSPQHLAGTHSIKFFDSSHAIEAAKQGLGIALADRMEIWDELLSDSLTVLPSIQIDTDRAYYLVTDKKPTGKVSLFINWLMNELENRHV